MFEQDYVMRQLKEMIRAIFKMLFGIDEKSQTAELLESQEDAELLESLLELADDGIIRDAERLLLYGSIDGSMGRLKTALLFYSYLNDKTDEFLDGNGFSREDIKSGINLLMDRYNLSDLARVILLDL